MIYAVIIYANIRKRLKLTKKLLHINSYQEILLSVDTRFFTPSVCHCENPCTSSSCGRMVYIYPGKDLWAYAERDEFYKVRTAVERSINHFKDSFGLAGHRAQNAKTFHADIIQLICVVLADKMNQHQYIRSLKPLVA